jgi:hypothetical protein
MSHTCHSSVIIGLRLNKEDAIKKTTKNGCKHTVPEKAKFCPECGEPREIEEKEAYYDEFKPYEVYSNYQKVIVGLVITEASSWDEDQAMSLINSLDRVEEVKKVLRPLIEKEGIRWKDSEFGIWLMAHL